MLKKLILTGVFALCCLFLFNACTSSENTPLEKDRPLDPWVFRSVLDKNSRILTAALDDNLWIAYYTETGSPYKAWKGGVNFEGAVYDMAHGPQPTSYGPIYFQNTDENIWSLYKEGKPVSSSYKYRGHTIENNTLTLHHNLLANDITIEIKETLDSDQSEGGSAILTQQFSIEAPTGYMVQRKTALNSIVIKEHVNSSASILEYTESENGLDKKTKQVSAILEMPSGQHDYSVQFGNPSIPDPNSVDADLENEKVDHLGARLIAKNDCKTCHNKNVKTIGPAYVSVAKRYADTDANKAYLLGKIKQGGSGVWGKDIMNAHPELGDADIKQMIDYILSLDDPDAPDPSEKKLANENRLAAQEVDEDQLAPGMIVTIHDVPASIERLPESLLKYKTTLGGIMPALGNIDDGRFGDVFAPFGLYADGYMEVKEDGLYTFRMWSDDGSKLWIDDQLIVDHDGRHGISMKENAVQLAKGYHKVKIQFFDSGGGRFLSFNIKRPSDEFWITVPPEMLVHEIASRDRIIGHSLPMASNRNIPGDKNPLDGMHPSFDIHQARPSSFTPKVGGMDFLPDGRMVVSTWDATGAVYILDNLNAENPENIGVKKIASGLAEPLGVQVIGNDIYVCQKQELTQLIDTDGDEVIDYYKTVCNDWGATSNFHEFTFGLEEKGGYLYLNLATGIQPGGASSVDQPLDRGSCIKIDPKSGKYEVVSNGLRTPNGIGKGFKNELFIADNQGDWLPASKIVHVTKDAWYGSKSVKYPDLDSKEETKPVVWLPQNEIGNSPSTPSYLNVGPYRGQMIHGEVTHGGVKRVFVEEVEGQLQGCVFRFMQGMEAGVNRLAWGPDGDLYIGGIGNNGNWQHNQHLWYGLQRVHYNENSTFEMLSVSARTNGIVLTFTEPLQANDGWDSNDFTVKQWYYKPTAEYGGPKLDEKILNIKSTHVSEDHTQVFLELDGMKEDHVLYVHLDKNFVSSLGQQLWSTEAWYTMNKIPQDTPGFISKNPSPWLVNALTENEKAEGWTLLFNGKDMDQWRNMKKETIGSGWIIEDNAIHLNAKKNPDGHWQTQDGGDIITKDQYKDFEFVCEWRINNCGNSGIMFNVQESDSVNYVWETGPEMQVLDNICHPDTRYVTHRAGDLYDMIECKYPAVKPAGEWNEARIKSKDGKVEFWLNGLNVVSFEMFTDEWWDMIKNSKFKDMKFFGKYEKGHISLQDHSDKVWYRNIKIREL